MPSRYKHQPLPHPHSHCPHPDSKPALRDQLLCWPCLLTLSASLNCFIKQYHSLSYRQSPRTIVRSRVQVCRMSSKEPDSRHRESFLCRACNVSFETHKTLMAHKAQKRAEGSLDHIHCKFCGMDFWTEAAEQRHIQEVSCQIRLRLRSTDTW